MLIKKWKTFIIMKMFSADRMLRKHLHFFTCAYTPELGIKRLIQSTFIYTEDMHKEFFYLVRRLDMERFTNC